MPGIKRTLPRREGLALAILSGLILLLALACGSASAPVTDEPGMSTSTPVSDGNVQTTSEAATPSPPPTSEATSVRTEDAQPTASGSNDTSESVRRGGGTGGASQAESDPRGGDKQSGPVPEGDESRGDGQAPPIPDKGELKYPNLGSRLDELVTGVEAGEMTAEEAAGSAAMHSGASVAVTFYLSGGVDGLVAFLEENGGDPRNVGEDYIEAYVPVTLLGRPRNSPESCGCGRSCRRGVSRAARRSNGRTGGELASAGE